MVQMRRVDQPSLLAAGMFIGIGLLALWEGSGLDMGELDAMGPGYMPRALAVMLILIGLAAGVRAFLSAAPEALQTLRARPPIVIAAAVAGFASLLALGSGLVIAAAWLLAIGSLATAEWTRKAVLISCATLIPFTTLVFVVGLGLQLKIWPW